MCFTINVNIVREEMERRFNANLLDPEEYRPSQYNNLQAHTISKLISKRNVEKNVPELINPFDYNSDKLF